MRFMRHAEVAAQVTRGALDQIASEQAHANDPLLAGEMQCLHGGSRPHREPPAAASARAAVGARPVRLRHCPASRCAVGADGPDRLPEPETSDHIGWKHYGQHGQVDALALEPARSPAPARRSRWHALVSFAYVHDVDGLPGPSIRICQQTFKMPETPVRMAVQRSICSQTTYPPQSP